MTPLFLRKYKLNKYFCQDIASLRTLPKTEIGVLESIYPPVLELRRQPEKHCLKGDKLGKVNDLYFLSSKPKKGIKNHIFFEAALRRRNLLFPPTQTPRMRDTALDRKPKPIICWRVMLASGAA
ncbi:MAG: hypothetical protein WBA39_23410 [Rivularia sp. (in: cyanobacteria)]